MEEVFEEVRFKELLYKKVMGYSDTQLEHLVASLMSDIFLGYQCYITREKGRGTQPLGDIILERPSPISDEINRILIEVKGGNDPSNPRKITRDELYAFIGKLDHQGEFEGIFVTTGTFFSDSETVVESMREKGKSIKLINGTRLVEIWTERMRLKGEYDYIKNV